MSINDGGPAFPRPASQVGPNPTWDQEGMTLRDYFAAAALTGLIAGGFKSYAAREALRIADELLAEREKEAS